MVESSLHYFWLEVADEPCQARLWSASQQANKLGIVGLIQQPEDS